MKKISLILLSLLITSQCYGSGITSDTKLYLPLNCTTNGATTVDGALEVLDCGSGGNVITQVGTATYQTATTKVWNSALDFDGNSDYTSQDGLCTDIASDTSGSVSAWIYSDTDTDDNTYDTIFFVGNTDASYSVFVMRYYFESGANPNIIQITLSLDGTAQWTWTYNLSAADIANWRHWVVSHNGTTPTFYRDGTDVTTTGTFTVSTDKSKWFKAICTDAAVPATYCYQGGTARSAVQYWDGKISDIRVWSSALSSANATTLYNSGNGTTAAIGSEVFWIKGCQDKISDAGSTPNIPNFNDNAQLDTSRTFLVGDGTALLLDGSDDIIILPDSTNWDICGSDADNWTVDTWVYCTDATGDRGIFGQYEDASNWMYLNIADLESVEFILKSASSVAINCATANGSFTNNANQHVALVKIGTKYAIYINGVQKAYLDDASTDTLGQQFAVGANSYGALNPMTGSMAHFRVQHSNYFNANPNVGLTDTIIVPTVPYSYEASTFTSNNSQFIVTE